MNGYDEAIKIMSERFGRDMVIAVATIDGASPAARMVDGYYEDGAFYVVTYSLSGKMRQIEKNPEVAIAGEWFSGRGRGENLGWVRKSENEAMMKKLRAAFAAWYDNGHTDETDANTCLLKIKLTRGTLMAQGKRYEIDFANRVEV